MHFWDWFAIVWIALAVLGLLIVGLRKLGQLDEAEQKKMLAERRELMREAERHVTER